MPFWNWFSLYDYIKGTHIKIEQLKICVYWKLALEGPCRLVSNQSEHDLMKRIPFPSIINMKYWVLNSVIKPYLHDPLVILSYLDLTLKSLLQGVSIMILFTPTILKQYMGNFHIPTYTYLYLQSKAKLSVVSIEIL